MSTQLPIQFEFNNDKFFSDYFAGNNQETINHLRSSVNGTGEKLIYIWGEPGLGKSHLLQACCHLSRQKDNPAFYLPLAAQKLPDISILEGLEKFKLVCIDDIQKIAGNHEWERAFFVFYNQLRELDHTMIISATQHPGKIPIQLPDLKTRLSWGLTLKLKPLTEEQKISALTFKAQKLGFHLSSQIGQYLLHNYSRDLPSLWQLLEKIDHETLVAKRKLTLPFLKQILKKTQ